MGLRHELINTFEEEDIIITDCHLSSTIVIFSGGLAQNCSPAMMDSKGALLGVA